MAKGFIPIVIFVLFLFIIMPLSVGNLLLLCKAKLTLSVENTKNNQLYEH